MHYYNLLNAESIHTQAIMLYKELIKGGGVGGECPLTPEEISIIVPMKNNMINCTDSFNQEIQEILLSNEDVEIKSGTYQDKITAEIEDYHIVYIANIHGQQARIQNVKYNDSFNITTLTDKWFVNPNYKNLPLIKV